MDVTDWLSTVTAQCRFVITPEMAAKVSPDLCLDAPALCSIQGDEGGDLLSLLPAPCLADLADPVVAVLTQVLESAISEGERENFSSFGPAEWARDRVASRIARLVVEAARVSPRATGVPFLALSRLTSGLLSREPGGPVPSAALARSLDALVELDAPRQGEILALVAWSLSARCSAAWGLAAQVDPAIRPTRFYQAMVRSRLAFVRRCSDPLPPTSLLLGALDLASDPALLDALRLVVEQGLAAIEARLVENRASAAERQLAAMIQPLTPAGLPVDRRAKASSFIPAIATTYLMRLADHAKPKDLQKVGIDRKRARQLLDPQALHAISATLHDLLTAIQLWDLVGGLQALVVPPESVRSSSWKRSVQPRLLVPRASQGGAEVHVVALRLGELRAWALEEARRQADPLIPAALEAAMDRAVSIACDADALRQSAGSHELFFLHSASAALSVAHRLAEALTPPLPLEFGPLRTGLSIARGPGVGVGLATGPVHGGTDGERVTLLGACLEEAVGLTGIAAPVRIPQDPLHVRHATVTLGGLVSHGLLASPAFVEALVEEARRYGRPFDLPGPGHEIAEIQAPFNAYSVAGAQEGRGGMVTVLLPLDPDSARSPTEILILKAEAFRDFHKHDRALPPNACRAIGVPAPIPSAPPDPAPSRPSTVKAAIASDPFSSEPGLSPAIQPPHASVASFSFDDEAQEEFEFDFDAPVPATASAPTLGEPDSNASFTSGQDEIEGLDEGVLVLEEPKAKPPVSAEEDDPFAVGGADDDSEVFSFDGSGGTGSGSADSFGAFDADFPPLEPLTPTSGESAPSFDGDDDDDPFGFSSASPATPGPGKPPVPDASGRPGPSATAAAPAPVRTSPRPPPTGRDPAEAPADDLDIMPLGYLPPAPADEPQDTQAFHEVVRTRRGSPQAAPKPTPPAADPPSSRAVGPSRVPPVEQDPPAEPARDARRPAPAEPTPPSMPASLLALIGDMSDDSSPPAAEQGAAFSLLGSSGEPWAPAPADEPLVPPEPEEEWKATPAMRFDVPPPARTAPRPPSPATDDPWSSAFADPAEALRESAHREDPTLGMEASEEDLSPEPPTEEPAPAAADGDPPGLADRLPPTSGGDAPMDDELSSDPMVSEGDAGAFESLFVDDGLDGPSDLDEDMEGWSTPAPGAFDPAPPDQAPRPAREAAPPSEAAPDDPFAGDFEEGLPQRGTLVPDDLPPPRSAQAASPPPAPRPQGTRAARTMPDFRYMFKGYRLFVTEQNTVLFGHRYGGLLIDVHEYPCGSDLPEAYRRFLADKVSERFVPRSDLSRPVPKQLESQDLDYTLLVQAFEALQG